MEIINIKKLIDKFTDDEVKNTYILLSSLIRENFKKDIKITKDMLLGKCKRANNYIETYSYYTYGEDYMDYNMTVLELVINFELFPFTNDLKEKTGVSNEFSCSIFNERIYNYCIYHENYGGDLISSGVEYRIDFEEDEIKWN